MCVKPPRIYIYLQVVSNPCTAEVEVTDFRVVSDRRRKQFVCLVQIATLKFFDSYCTLCGSYSVANMPVIR